MLPVVADLTSTHESAWVRCVGGSKAGKNNGTKRNKGDVEVSSNIAKAGTGIHASIPTRPVIDGVIRAVAVNSNAAHKVSSPVSLVSPQRFLLVVRCVGCAGRYRFEMGFGSVRDRCV
jgi:hypothetical protein